LLTRDEKRTYAWSLFRWLRDVHILDDLFEEEPISFLVRGPEVRVFYPIKTRSISARTLRRILFSYFQKTSTRTAWLFIPELLVNIAAERGIPKRDFLDSLVALYREDPVTFHLEMTSSIRTDDRCVSHYHYSNYPIVAGVPRSHVRICAKAAHCKE
jgi:hypothetical protein